MDVVNKISLSRLGLILVGVLACVFFILSFDNYYFPAEEHNHYIHINVSNVIFTTDEKFLSVALDTSFMREKFAELSDSDWEKLVNLTKWLSPAYIRLGGTAADQVLFKLNESDHEVRSVKKENHLQEDNLSPTDYLNISGHDWIKLNNFVNRANLRLLLDLNVLLRKGRQWDSRNAEELLQFSDLHDIDMDFQLGNEPNNFQHVFNVTIPGDQLGRDFEALRKILYSSKRYRKSQLIGPDVTRPKHFDQPSLQYLEEFLSSVSDLNAVSWHQYYLNGRNATEEDFLDPETLNLLPEQIKAVESVVRRFSKDIPIWLSETSSAYGSGAPGLSDRFIASFLWLDKLGLAAKMGIKVVIRQSLFKGHYALIDDDFRPLPDFWISLFYKHLVGRNALQVRFAKGKLEKHLRFYSHCLKRSDQVYGNVILIGINLSNGSEYVIPGGISAAITPLIFTSPDDDLTSKEILLNGIPLEFTEDIEQVVFNSIKNSALETVPLHIPPYSLAFWIFHGERSGPCDEE